MQLNIADWLLATRMWIKVRLPPDLRFWVMYSPLPSSVTLVPESTCVIQRGNGGATKWQEPGSLNYWGQDSHSLTRSINNDCYTNENYTFIVVSHQNVGIYLLKWPVWLHQCRICPWALVSECTSFYSASTMSTASVFPEPHRTRNF